MPRRKQRTQTVWPILGGVGAGTVCLLVAIAAVALAPAGESPPAPRPVPTSPPRSSPPPSPPPVVPPRPAPHPERTIAHVQEVIDGDTILVRFDDHEEKVRYLGINCPESIDSTSKGIEFYGREAARRNKELVAGRDVELEFDGRRTDVYGRLLAYVWVGDSLVNRLLIEEGFAEVYRRAPYIQRFAEFVRLERDARARGLGMWNDASRRRWSDHDR